MLGTFGNLTEIVGRTLAREGHDLDKLLADRGVDLASHDTGRLSPDRISAIWDVVEETSSDPAFGLSMLVDIDFSDFDELGVAIVAHASRESAMQCLVDFHHLLSDYIELSLDRSDENFTLKMTGTEAAHWRAFEFSAALLVRCLRVRFGRNVDPIEVKLGFENEAAAYVYPRYFRCPVELGADQTELMFSVVDDVELSSPRSRLVARFEHFLKEEMHSLTSSGSWSARVSDEVVRQLADGVPTIDQVSDALQVSSRSLQRYLAEEGLSYREIVENCRRRLARNWVRGQRYSLVDITFLLGFSSSSAFSRAYRRWYGLPPRADRRAAVQAGLE